MEVINYNKSSAKKKINVNPILPQINKGGFVLILAGARGSGKTNLLINLMIRDDMYKKVFKPKYTIIFSPSINLDESFNDIKAKWKFEKYDDKIINDVMEQQKEIKAEFGKSAMPYILVILDDNACENSFKARGELERLAMRGRHLNISVILTTQKLTAVCRGIRTQAEYIFIWEPLNGSEYDSIMDEYAQKSDKKAFKNMLEYVYKDPYEFLYINLADKKQRYRKSLNEILDLKSF